MMVFATLANVKDYIGITGNITDGKLNIILEQVNYDIEKYGGGVFVEGNPALKNAACRWVEAQFNKTSGVKSETNIDVSQSFEDSDIPADVKGILDRAKGVIQTSGATEVDCI